MCFASGSTGRTWKHSPIFSRTFSRADKYCVCATMASFARWRSVTSDAASVAFASCTASFFCLSATSTSRRSTTRAGISTWLCMCSALSAPCFFSNAQCGSDKGHRGKRCSVERKLRHVGPWRVGTLRWNAADFLEVKKRPVGSGWAVTHQLKHFDAFGSSFVTTKMSCKVDFAPSGRGWTLMSATSTEIFAPARHFLMLIRVSAANGAFLRYVLRSTRRCAARSDRSFQRG